MITEQKNTGLLWDMHAHLTCLTNERYRTVPYESLKKLAYGELEYRRSQNIAAFFSCGTPEEWEFMKKVLRDDADCASVLSGDAIRLSFGIHPWYSSQYHPETCRNYLESCDVIGEIGMDSVWCEVPLVQQREIFEMQLQIGADLGKPVILHTKGQETEISEMIRDYPGKICVHWYSGEICSLERYLEKDCYFTLGPDLAWKEKEELYQYMLRNIPDNRLFLETDGLDAVIWAYEECSNDKKINSADAGKDTAEYTLLKTVMNTNLELLSVYKKKKPEEMLFQLQQNLNDFLTI